MRDWSGNALSLPHGTRAGDRGGRPGVRLGAQLGPVAEVFQRLWVGDGFHVLHGAAVHHVADGDLRDLPGARARDLRHLHDLRRHVAGTRALADLLPDALDARIVQRDAGAHDHEQHDAGVAVPFLADGDALEDLVQLLHLAVDLGRTDAHAAG